MTTGIVLLIYPTVVNHAIAPVQLEKTYKETMGKLSADNIRVNLEEAQEKHDEENFDFDAVGLLTTLPVIPKLEQKNVIGEIHIPSVDLSLPILYGSTDANMNVASGTMKPAQRMGEGNYALAGHNVKNKTSLFAPLRRIQVGDVMYITDKEKVYTYKMVRSEVVQPNRIDVIDDVPGKRLLTLVSCFSADGSDRIIVTGELVDVEDYAYVQNQTAHEKEINETPE